MQTIQYLFTLFASLGLGALTAKFVGRDLFHRFVALSLDLVLYLLLFFMGVNTGSLPDIAQQLATMGLQSLLATVAVLVGCLAVGALCSPLMRRLVGTNGAHRGQQVSWKRLKTPFVLVAIVGLGMVLSMSTEWFGWFDTAIVTALLYVLLFLSGMQMVQNRVNLVPLLRSPLLLVVPLLTLAGTYAGALAIPLFSDYSLRESLTLVSGFGWYTLSGVMISDLGNPALGTVSFLSNLFRESASFFLIPALSAIGAPVHHAVSIAGATSMDVTLPLLRKSYSETIVPLAIVHGCIMTLLAPVFIPLWY